MADDAISANEAELARSRNERELQARERRFTASPDPWQEIVRLEHGGDRTFASTVQQMVLNAEPAQRGELEAMLLTALAQPELTDAGRQFVCRMLGWIGSEAAVPGLAPLLENEKTADDARLALDGIDHPTVDAAYRSALERLRGRARVGLIGSLARRGDHTALEPLTAIAIDPGETAEVREAAERAVEHLAGEQAR